MSDDSKAKSYLDGKDPRLVEAVLKKGPRAFTTIYNRMCRKCKALVGSNSDRPFTDYCSRCQEMARKVLK